MTFLSSFISKNLIYFVEEVSSMDKKKYYKRLFNYFKDEKLSIIAYAILSLISIVMNTISPAISAKTLEAITNVDLDRIIRFSFLAMIVYALNLFLNYFDNRCSRRVTRKVEIKIKEEVSKELFDLEIKNFDKEGTGFFANRIENEPVVLASVFTRFNYNIADIFSSLGIFIYLFIICPPIGFFNLFYSLLNFFIRFQRNKKWEKERKEIDAMREKSASNFGELIHGIKDIKVLNLKNFLIKKTIREQKNMIEFYDNMNKKDQKAYLWTDSINILMDFLFIVLGVYLIKSEALLGSSFLVIYMYRGRANYFFTNMMSIYRSVKEINLSMERLYELVDDTKYRKEKFGKKRIETMDGSIEFKNVNFGYENQLVLKDMSFRIDKCQTIGIVGKSGAGKSTLFNLIEKLYRVEEGQILLDDIDIDELDENSIRENITTITQNPYIFNMSIKENLKITKPYATDEEVEAKCKQCALDEYIASLEKGMDTLVGENGVILSGGLKQRLAIARAILKNSKIILLDEATSSLDNDTQDFIHKSIKKIRKDYTILIIAHRLSTVIDCDKILVIDDGRVVGFDTHENLVKNNKFYKNLYKKELK